MRGNGGVRYILKLPPTKNLRGIVTASWKLQIGGNQEKKARRICSSGEWQAVTGLEGEELVGPNGLIIDGKERAAGKAGETAERVAKLTPERSDGLSANPNVLDNCQTRTLSGF